MSRFIHARIYPGADDDLIAWLDAQPAGRRSEAIRSLLREGLRARKLRAELDQTIRQAIADALRDVQVVADRQGVELDGNQVEEAFGEQLDQLLNRFG